MFWKKPTSKHPRFGILAYSHDRWVSEEISSEAGNVFISIEGAKLGPSETSFAVANEVFAKSQSVVSEAIAYVQANTQAREFIDGHGEIVLDGFSFRSAKNTFEVELALSEWPDAMISVVFKDGIPCDVLLED